jgi:hypothetical protein
MSDLLIIEVTARHTNTALFLSHCALCFAPFSFFTLRFYRLASPSCPPSFASLSVFEYVPWHAQSGDGLRLSVELKVAFRCNAVKKRWLAEPRGLDPKEPLVFSNVSGAALVRVIKYCRHEWPENHKPGEVSLGPHPHTPTSTITPLHHHHHPLYTHPYYPLSPLLLSLCVAP